MTHATNLQANTMDNITLEKSEPMGVADLLAADFNAMSFTERNRVFEELHGVDPVVVETPDYVASCLLALETELNNLPQKLAYEQAFHMNPSYVTNPKFRLMFLRASKFDAGQAARRLVKFLDNKLEIFGPSALTRSLYLSDFDSATTQMFASGLHQFLPERTRSGKVVLVSCPRAVPREYDSLESSIKSLFYLLTTHAETDEESQKRGYVHILFLPGQSLNNRLWEAYKRMGGFGEVVPIRVTGLHFCSPSDWFKTYKNMVVATLAKSTRVRLKFHGGSPTECVYGLLTFGIPVGQLPVGADREARNTAQVKWIAKQKARDQALKGGVHFVGIDIPGIKDVLLGRGRGLQDHVGNVQMRHLVKSHIDDYRKGSRPERDKLTWFIIGEIKKQNGRFLKRNDDGWFVEVSDVAAFEKIGMNFQKVRSQVRKTQGRQEQESVFIQTTEGKRAKTTSLAHQAPLGQVCK